MRYKVGVRRRGARARTRGVALSKPAYGQRRRPPDLHVALTSTGAAAARLPAGVQLQGRFRAPRTARDHPPARASASGTATGPRNCFTCRDGELLGETVQALGATSRRRTARRRTGNVDTLTATSEEAIRRRPMPAFSLDQHRGPLRRFGPGGAPACKRWRRRRQIRRRMRPACRRNASLTTAATVIFTACDATPSVADPRRPTPATRQRRVLRCPRRCRPTRCAAPLQWRLRAGPAARLPHTQFTWNASRVQRRA